MTFKMATWNPKFKTKIYNCFHTEVLNISMKTFFYTMVILGQMGPIYHPKMGNKLTTIAVQHPIRVKTTRTKLKLTGNLLESYQWKTEDKDGHKTVIRIGLTRFALYEMHLYQHVLPSLRQSGG
jgi:hypothetical protein